MDNQERSAVEVFEDRSHAKRAIDELLRNNFTAEEIGYVIPEDRPIIDLPPQEHGTLAGEGAAAGAASGTAIGGLVGAALATALIPGVGPVIAGGLLVGIASGAVAGLAGGGLLGALIGLSVPEEEARGHEKAFHSGQTVVTVRAPGRYDEAMAILKRVAEEPDVMKLHPGDRAAHLSESSDPGPGSGSVFPGE